MTLLHLCALHGWHVSRITACILDAASAAPLDTTWQVVRSLLSEVKGDGSNSNLSCYDTHRDLITVIVRCLSASVRTSTLEVQREIVDWLCHDCLTGRDSVNEDIMTHHQTRGHRSQETETVREILYEEILLMISRFELF